VVRFGVEVNGVRIEERKIDIEARERKGTR